MGLDFRLTLFFLCLGLLCLAFFFLAAQFLAQTGQFGGFGRRLDKGRRGRGDDDGRGGYWLLGLCQRRRERIDFLLVPFGLLHLALLFLAL